jgi:aquaporin Z
MKTWQKYAAEFLGTFVLVFVGSLTILNTNEIIAIAFGFSIALLAGLYAFGEVSGGHFNPIVSLAMFLDRRLSALDTIWYWMAQFAGGIAAALVIWVTYASRTQVTHTANRSSHDARAFFLELICSAIFVAVFLQATKSNKYGASALIAIPLTLFAIHLALITVDGTSVNPARTLGPDLVGATAWSDIWIFLLAPPAGAIIGWAAHMVTVRGDMSLRDDLTRAATDMRGGFGEMRGEIRQGPGQVPPPPPPSSPDPPTTTGGSGQS